MGTLDDAIREHLELKRRAGASADEVRQLESEALGPARRDAPAQEPAEAGEPAVGESEPDPVPAPVLTPEPEPSPPVPVADAAAPDVPRAEPDPEWLDEDPFGDAGVGGDRPETTGNPPSDYVAPDDEGEDLLEETPDFLQETPDHDKLWFEQKPPRDFDFDN